MYYYQAFGLKIASEIEFLNLPVSLSDEASQIKIKLGLLPETLPGQSFTYRYFQACDGKLLARIKDVGRILVENGESITFEPSRDAKKANIRLILINLGLSAILHQRGVLALHASAVATPSGAVLFCGERGVGKSTLAAGLYKCGWPLVCDDKAALYLEGEQVFVIPSFPEVRLWQDAIDYLDFTTVRMEKMPDKEKYNIGLEKGFQDKPLLLRAIFLIKPSLEDSINHKPLVGIQKFQTIKQNTYSNQFLKDMGLLTTHFSLASVIASQTEMAEIIRPQKTSHPQELIKYINSFLQERY